MKRAYSVIKRLCITTVGSCTHAYKEWSAPTIHILLQLVLTLLTSRCTLLLKWKKGVILTKTKQHFWPNMSQTICLFDFEYSCSWWQLQLFLWALAAAQGMQDRTMTRSVDRNSCDECVWNFAFPERVVLIVKVYRQGVLLELLKVSSGHTSNRGKMPKICPGA